MKKTIKHLFLVLSCTIFTFCFCLESGAQNSMIGDGFGGRLWYKPTNYAIGSYSGYAICENNKQLYGWGSNTYGQLGNGQTTSTVTPVEAIGMSDIRFFTSGYLSCAIKNDNTGWVWGTTPAGGGGPKFTSTPQQVITDAKFVDASAYHAAFVKNDGTVWFVGSNLGQFGNGTFVYTNTTSPEQMTGVNSAVRVACGGIFTIILLSDSSVMQAGPGTDMAEAAIHINGNGLLPESVPVLGHNIIDIKANERGAYALTASGEVYSWGFDNYYGLLGNGATHYDPQVINFGSSSYSIVAISSCSDGDALYALDSLGNVYGAGWGQLMANGSGLNENNPILINTNCKDILCAELFGYVVKNDSTLWVTGGSGSDYGPGLGEYHGSVFMDQPNITFPAYVNTWIQLDPTGSLMNLCAPTVLPVNLLDFSAVQRQSSVFLKWIVEKEINVQSYFVERSSDGIIFKNINTIRATGGAKRYNCIDADPAPAVNYYRLRIRDIDGKESFSEIRKVMFERKGGMSIFPNPAKNMIQISVSGIPANSSAILKVSDVNGRVVLEQKIEDLSQLKSVDISSIVNGNYLIKIISDRKVFNGQIVVIH